MSQRLSVLGAPSSAGAYAPGQEKAPGALRAAGLVRRLFECGIDVEDRGDVPGYRWQVDKAYPRAMNVAKVATVVPWSLARWQERFRSQRASVSYT